MSQPLIGITSHRTKNEQGLALHSVTEAYILSVASAGGIPVLIPLGQSEEILNAMLSRLDGVLFSGGGDILPETYGGQPHPQVYGIDAERDRIELHLLRQVIQDKTPFLGICRGFQVVNVGLGGTLYEDIAAQRPGALKHDYHPDWPRNYLSHTVRIEPTSRLASILGLMEAQVNSLHHQGAREIAPGLNVTAHAPDGIVEAVELPDHPFGIAVQWHPEWLQEHAPMRLLFQAFTQAASQSK
ncbi:MAG: gamma-glutamyl-gamma-aminobutyrate hydrolase family protein [Anaerolineales bacterium]|nr:gamma-glutamyl-gamma-aminobutyrate hydrolase family protein [Anaerolineales bacterium]